MSHYSFRYEYFKIFATRFLYLISLYSINTCLSRKVQIHCSIPIFVYPSSCSRLHTNIPSSSIDWGCIDFEALPAELCAWHMRPWLRVVDKHLLGASEALPRSWLVILGLLKASSGTVYPPPSPFPSSASRRILLHRPVPCTVTGMTKCRNWNRSTTGG